MSKCVSERFTSWHTEASNDVLKRLKTSENGLTSKEADARLNKYGENILPQKSIFVKEIDKFIIMFLLFFWL